MTRLTPADHVRVSTAIRAVEARTSGEIFCVLAGRVSSYRDVSLGWAAAAALLVPLALIPLGFDAAWFPGVSDSWEAAHMAARDLTVGRALSVYAVVQAAVFIAVFLLTCIPALQRRLTPRGVRRARVRRAALQQFMAHGLHATQARTGVLIFAALADHQVEVVADAGIHALVDPDVWAQAVDVLTVAIREGRPADGFEAAVAVAGEVLARNFPPRARPIDELPNRVVEI